MALLLNKVERDLLQILASEVLDSSEQVVTVVPLRRLSRVLSLAKEHTVLGLVAHAVCKGRVVIEESNSETSGQSLESRKMTKEDLVMNLMKVEVLHQRKYMKFSHVLAEFARLMESHHVHYVVFKGMAMAQLYSSPSARTMGDVDFYVQASDFNRALEVIETSWKVDIDREEVDKHYSFDYQGIRFEMHYQIETFGSTRHQRYFNRMMDENVSKGTDGFELLDAVGGDSPVRVAMLSPTENLIVVFKHWFNHLLVEGVGLRQTVDLAVLLHIYRDQIEAAKLMSALEHIGYLPAFRALLVMMRKYFQLKGVESYCILNERDEQYADKLMATVLESGNFGRKAYQNHSAGNKKSLETARKAMAHCFKFFWLAPLDILCLIPKRIWISAKQKV